MSRAECLSIVPQPGFGVKHSLILQLIRRFVKLLFVPARHLEERGDMAIQKTHITS